MIRIIFQGIRQSPRLIWQSAFQPSKAAEFANESNDNVYIFLTAFVFCGLVCGGILAVPHYYLYHNLLQSVLFAFACAFAGAFAGVFAFAFAFAVAVAGAVAFAVELAVAGAVAGAVGIGSFSFLPVSLLKIFLIISVLCWLIAALDELDKIDLFFDNEIFLGIGWGLMAFSVGGGIPHIKDYGILIFSISFGVCYFFVSGFWFIDENKKVKIKFGEKEIDKDNVTHQKFSIVQKASLIWCPILAGLLYLMVFFDIKPELHTKFIIMAVGFVIMPVFFLHIPDYLLCLPLWFFQLHNASKHCGNKTELIQTYENSILFKHEMLFCELPKLHNFMAMIARNKDLGVREAVKRINHLYWLTFQQTQATKAIIELGKDREIAHEYIHYLLEEGNLPLLKILAKDNRLAELYLNLFDKTDGPAKEKNDFSLPLPEARRSLMFWGRRGNQKNKNIPKTLGDKLDHFRREMAEQRGHHLNAEMVATLDAAHGLLTAEKIKDFYPALSELKKIRRFFTEINYFNELQNLTDDLERIKDNFAKIENVERFETRRAFLTEQRQHLETLAKSSESAFYEPFATIWKQALEHFASVIQQEIDIQQGTAILDINLKNPKIPVSPEERQLYFDIRNTGQEFASDVSVTLSADNTSAILFCGDSRADIQILEADTAKEMAFSVVANQPVETVIRGTVTFSDRNRDGKTVPFSFPVTVYEEIREFQTIPNPYIAGQPLTQQSPVYFGREDAYSFIDRNILAGAEHHTIVCYGLRRTGKSSLLYRIVRDGLSDSRLVPVLFDMQGIDDEKDFYLTLTDALAEKLAPDASYDIDSFGGFKRFIRKAVPDTSDKIVVVLVDEFEELQMRVEEGRISGTVFSNIRHLMQHENRLIFLFCGTHKLEEMSADYWSIFFNTAIYLRINYLSEDDTRQLIRKPVEEHLTWDDFAVDQILKITHGQPYLTQLICRTVVNDLNDAQKRNYATVDDVDRAVAKIIEQGDDHFSAHIWKEAAPSERLILSAASEEMTQKQLDHIGLTALTTKVGTVTDRFSSRECVEILNNLVSKEILEQNDSRYHFPVNLLRKWIATRHPLRQVREEI